MKAINNSKALSVKPDGVHDDSEIAGYHLSQINRPESMRFLERLRKIADRHDVIMLSEVVVADNSLQTGKRFLKGSNGAERSHLVYSGAHLREEPISCDTVYGLLRKY